jgi:transposase
LIARIAELEALVSSQAAEIARLTALLAQLQAELDALRTAKPSDKNSRNSSVPPSQSYPENRPESQTRKKKGPRHGHPGTSRKRLSPTRTLSCHPTSCHCCGEDLGNVVGHVHRRSQLLEIPPLSLEVIEAVCYRCCCPACGAVNTAPYPDGWDPRQWFGPRLQSLLAYLHHHHHIAYARLVTLVRDLFDRSISEGALANVLARVQTKLRPTLEAIAKRVRESKVVGSDETRARVNGQTRWRWVVQSREASYHFVATTRGARELIDFYGESLPEVQESDCYAAQLASPVAIKQVCQAHQLRDLLYAIEHGDTEYAARMHRLIRLAIHLANRRDELRPELFAHQARRLMRLGDRIGLGPKTANPFGEGLQERYRRLRAHWWVFLERDDVSATNNRSEQALRPEVVHRKVLGGFRSEWGAEAYAGFLSVVQTLQREGAELMPRLLEMLAPHDHFLLTVPSHA